MGEVGKRSSRSSVTPGERWSARWGEARSTASESRSTARRPEFGKESTAAAIPVVPAGDPRRGGVGEDGGAGRVLGFVGRGAERRRSARLHAAEARCGVRERTRQLRFRRRCGVPAGVRRRGGGGGDGEAFCLFRSVGGRGGQAAARVGGDGDFCRSRRERRFCKTIPDGLWNCDQVLPEGLPAKFLRQKSCARATGWLPARRAGNR